MQNERNSDESNPYFECGGAYYQDNITYNGTKKKKQKYIYEVL